MLQSRLTIRALLGASVSLLLLAPSLPAEPRSAPAQELKPKEQEKLGKLLGEYFDARKEESGIIEAQEDIQKELEKIGKKRAGKDGNALQAALALSGDLGQAFYYATDYSKTARSVKAGSVTDISIDVPHPAGSKVTYAVWAPSKYKPKDGPYPVILALPGLSGGKPMKGSEHLIEDWADGELRESCIIVALDMPADIAAWSQVVTDGDDPQPGGVSRVMFAFREVRDKYAIDFDRVFLAGSGPGVEAALEIAARFPHVFAGVIGRAGDAGEGLDVTNFRNLPTFFAGAGAGATAFVERAKQAGFENSVIKPDGSESDFLTWIKESPRNGNPLHVTLNAKIGQRAYWVAVPKTTLEVDAIVDAKIDQESNTVTVTGEYISTVEIFFNDQLLDLSKPVKVIVNGLESEHKIARNLSMALALTYGGTSDPGRFYVARSIFDMPE